MPGKKSERNSYVRLVDTVGGIEPAVVGHEAAKEAGAAAERPGRGGAVQLGEGEAAVGGAAVHGHARVPAITNIHKLDTHRHFFFAFRLKRLHKKELSSRPVGQSFHGLDALSLSLLKTAGTTADKKWKERKL